MFPISPRMDLQSPTLQTIEEPVADRQGSHALREMPCLVACSPRLSAFNPRAAIDFALTSMATLAQRHLHGDEWDSETDKLELDSLRNLCLQRATCLNESFDVGDNAARRAQFARIVGGVYHAVGMNAPSSALERAYLFLDAVQAYHPGATASFTPFALNKSLDDSPVSVWAVGILFDRRARERLHVYEPRQVYEPGAFYDEILQRRTDLALIRPGELNPITTFERCADTFDVVEQVSTLFQESRSRQELHQYLSMWRYVEVAPFRPPHPHRLRSDLASLEPIGQWHIPHGLPIDGPPRHDPHSANDSERAMPEPHDLWLPPPSYGLTDPDEPPVYPDFQQIRAVRIFAKDQPMAFALSLAFRSLMRLHAPIEDEGDPPIEDWRGDHASSAPLETLRRAYCNPGDSLRAAHPATDARTEQRQLARSAAWHIQQACQLPLNAASEEACLLLLDFMHNFRSAFSDRLLLITLIQRTPAKPASERLLPAARHSVVLCSHRPGDLSRFPAGPLSLEQCADWIQQYRSRCLVIDPAGVQKLNVFDTDNTERATARLRRLLQHAHIDDTVWPVDVFVTRSDHLHC